VPGVDYQSGDLAPGAADRVLDLRSLDLPDASVTLLLCVHVLEHVDDEARAFAEIRRVLEPDGRAILQVPRRRGPTLEEEGGPLGPAERLARFGQEDHVRVYGDDYADRLARAGFSVRVDVFRDELSPEEHRRFGLLHPDAADPHDDRLWEVVTVAP
jgi:SAM-dependent methyltransferase